MSDQAARYPVELERTHLLADGRYVFIRPIRPDDETAMRKALTNADGETLYARFLGSPPHDATSIRRLVEVDYVHRLALVAFAANGHGVGVARYEGQSGSDSAELAVVVAVAWRRAGLGALLLAEIRDAAVARGIHRFTALVMTENTPVLNLLRASSLGFTMQNDRGISEVVMMLDSLPAPDADEVVG